MKRTHHVDLRGFEVNLLRFREGARRGGGGRGAGGETAIRPALVGDRAYS